MKKTWLALFTLFLATTALAGCNNTWQGAGEDVETMGEKMQDPNK